MDYFISSRTKMGINFSPCYKVIIVYSKHTNEMCSLNEGLGYSGLCSGQLANLRFFIQIICWAP